MVVIIRDNDGLMDWMYYIECESRFRWCEKEANPDELEVLV